MISMHTMNVSGIINLCYKNILAQEDQKLEILNSKMFESMPAKTVYRQIAINMFLNDYNFVHIFQNGTKKKSNL